MMNFVLLFILVPLVVAFLGVRLERHFGSRIDSAFQRLWRFVLLVLSGGDGSPKELGRLFARSPGLLITATHRLLFMTVKAFFLFVLSAGLTYRVWAEYLVVYMEGGAVPFWLVCVSLLALFSLWFAMFGVLAKLAKLERAVDEAERLLMERELERDVPGQEIQ
jgi:hypothetical protein